MHADLEINYQSSMLTEYAMTAGTNSTAGLLKKILKVGSLFFTIALYAKRGHIASLSLEKKGYRTQRNYNTNYSRPMWNFSLWNAIP